MSVFVSGGTGFIGQHIVNQLLEQNYRVITSARSQEKADTVLTNFKHNPNLIVTINGDLSRLDAFDQPFQEYGSQIKYVIHTASPVTFPLKDIEKDVLIPAVNGTKSILQAIQKHCPNGIESFVMTSSVAAISTFKESFDPKVTANEQSWNDYTWESAQASGQDGYFGSKKFAEKYLWDFLNDNKDTLKFKAATILPCFVFGPQMFDSSVKPQLNLSCEVVNSLIHTGKDEKYNYTIGKYIHVEDVAKAHIMAMQDSKFDRKRLLLSEGNFNSHDILNYLNNDFPVLKDNIPVCNPSETAENKPSKDITFENTATRKLLGFNFKNLKECVDGIAEQVLRHENRL
ncbi:methylglyoxal reductase (NADPH-dependent) gre2 [Maudiozyma exigua]|uniref:Methylglyoxal reductase (NADPH-dependent) gre2 n=1 Tax=Maudiozyma exigua TaxID=34358 RepID=A0A9P6WCS4_MAUEX|nr:methylglyoxal reductase (NADPH-dependent) gre2 [Kazachstania exigua]